MKQLTKEGKTPQEIAAYNLTVSILEELQKGGFDAFYPGGYHDISAKVGLIIYRTILKAEQSASADRKWRAGKLVAEQQGLFAPALPGC